MEHTQEKLQSAAWWDLQLEGQNEITANLPAQLVRLMGNLQHLRKGEPFAIEAVCTVLCQIERAGKAAAEAEMEEAL